MGALCLWGRGSVPGLGFMTQACLSLTTGFPSIVSVFDTHKSRCDACQFQYCSQDGFPGALMPLLQLREGLRFLF